MLRYRSIKMIQKLLESILTGFQVEQANYIVAQIIAFFSPTVISEPDTALTLRALKVSYNPGVR